MLEIHVPEFSEKKPTSKTLQEAIADLIQRLEIQPSSLERDSCLQFLQKIKGNTISHQELLAGISNLTKQFPILPLDVRQQLEKLCEQNSMTVSEIQKPNWIKRTMLIAVTLMAILIPWISRQSSKVADSSIKIKKSAPEQPSPVNQVHSFDPRFSASMIAILSNAGISPKMDVETVETFLKMFDVLTVDGCNYLFVQNKSSPQDIVAYLADEIRRGKTGMQLAMLIGFALRDGLTPTELAKFDNRFTLNNTLALLKRGKDATYANTLDRKFNGAEVIRLASVNAPIELANKLINGDFTIHLYLKTEIVLALFENFDYTKINFGTLRKYHKGYLITDSWREHQGVPAFLLAENHISPEDANFYLEQLPKFEPKDVALCVIFNIPIDVVKSYQEVYEASKVKSVFGRGSGISVSEISAADILGISCQKWMKTREAYYQILKKLPLETLKKIEPSLREIKDPMNLGRAQLFSNFFEDTLWDYLISKKIDIEFASPLLEHGTQFSEITSKYISIKMGPQKMQMLKTACNIDEEFLYRYDVESLNLILQNLNPDFNKEYSKIAVIILPKKDDNQAFRDVHCDIVSLTADGCRVFVYEAKNEQDVFQACEKFVAISGHPIDRLSLNGHGTAESIDLGCDPDVNLDHKNNGLLTVKDRELYQKLSALMSKNGHVILNACSSGRTLAGIVYDEMRQTVLSVTAPRTPTSAVILRGSERPSTHHLFPVSTVRLGK